MIGMRITGNVPLWEAGSVPWLVGRKTPPGPEAYQIPSPDREEGWPERAG